MTHNSSHCSSINASSYNPSTLSISNTEIYFEANANETKTIDDDDSYDHDNSYTITQTANYKYETSTSLGKWSVEEHKKFIEGLYLFGKQWKRIQQYIKTRTAIQIRSHSQKFFLRIQRKYVELYGKEEIKEGNMELICGHILYVLTKRFNCEFILDFFGKINKINCNENEKLKRMLHKKKKSFLELVYKYISGNVNEVVSYKKTKKAIQYRNERYSLNSQSKSTSFESASANESIDKEEQDKDNCANSQYQVNFSNMVEHNEEASDNIFDISFTFEEHDYSNVLDTSFKILY